MRHLTISLLTCLALAGGGQGAAFAAAAPCSPAERARIAPRAKGVYEVRLPRVCRRVVDVTCDRVVATDADRFAYPMEAFQTGVFLLD